MEGGYLEDLEYHLNVRYEVINGKRYTIDPENVHTFICEESESHLTPQQDECELKSESDSEDSSAEPAGVPTLGWRDVIVTMDTTAISIYYSEHHDLQNAEIEIT